MGASMLMPQTAMTVQATPMVMLEDLHSTNRVALPPPGVRLSHHLGCQGVQAAARAAKHPAPTRSTAAVRPVLSGAFAPSDVSDGRAPPDLQLLLGVSRT